jgi:beta-glucosidase
MFRVMEHLIKAHKSAYKAIKEVLPEAKIGIAKNNVYYEPFRQGNYMDRILTWGANRIGNHYILEKISKQTDFIGINYYFYNRLRFDFKTGFEEMNKNFSKQQGTPEEPRSDMGWRTYPEGLYYLLKDLKRYHKPVYITENGIANATDDMRARFIREHLYWARKAMDFGTDVRGYFYWSLTDTYEWHDGFNPKFGLVEVDFETQERRIRDSATVFKEIALTPSLSPGRGEGSSTNLKEIK